MASFIKEITGPVFRSAVKIASDRSRDTGREQTINLPVLTGTAKVHVIAGWKYVTFNVKGRFKDTDESLLCREFAIPRDTATRTIKRQDDSGIVVEYRYPMR